jgi:hypothetical protein
VGLTELDLYLAKDKLMLLQGVHGTSLYKHIMRMEEVKPIVEDGIVYIDSDPELFQ